MKPPAQGLHRFAQVLALAGTLGFLGFLAIDVAMPGRIPDSLSEDRIRLSKSPELVSQPKALAFLELSDGAVPARIPNFHHIEPEARRDRLQRLNPGAEIVVVRPTQPSDWLAPFDIVAARTGDTELLTTADTLRAHRSRASGSRMVTFWLAVAGFSLLGLRRVLYPGMHAA